MAKKVIGNQVNLVFRKNVRSYFFVCSKGFTLSTAKNIAEHSKQLFAVKDKQLSGEDFISKYESIVWKFFLKLEL